MSDRKIKLGNKKIEKQTTRPKYLLEFFSSFLVIFLIILPPSLATTTTSYESVSFFTDIFLYLTNVNIVRILYIISVTILVFYLYINKNITTTSIGIANSRRVKKITNIDVVVIFGLQLLGGIIAGLLVYWFSILCGTFSATNSLGSIDSSMKGFIFKFGEGYYKAPNDAWFFIVFQLFLNTIFIWIFFFFSITVIAEVEKKHLKIFARWGVSFLIFLMAYKFGAHSFNTSRILGPAIASYLVGGANNLRLALLFSVSHLINFIILAIFTANYQVKGI